MSRRRMTQVYDAGDLQRLARRRLPRAVYEVIEGGAGDEVTLRRNREAFERIAVRPRALVDVSKVDTSTTILGEPASMPLMLAPCSFARMCHSAAEPAVARAAGRAGTLFAVATASSERLETVAEAATGPLWFQLYMRPDHDANVALLDRVENAGYRTLCVTVDTAIKPYRERDLRNRITMPLTPSPQLLLTGLSRPSWAKDFVLGRSPDGASRLTVARNRLNPLRSRKPAPAISSATASIARFADGIRHIKSVTAEDLSFLRERWSGPLVVKGILRAEDVPALIDLGVDGIVVSNHGGRNLDGAQPTMDVLGEVVEAAADRAEVFLDSGVRRGMDAVKAVALGARAVLVGRPYMYALGAAGEAGVDKLLALLHDEIRRAMSQLGATSVDEITASLVTRD